MKGGMAPVTIFETGVAEPNTIMPAASWKRTSAPPLSSSRWDMFSGVGATRRAATRYGPGDRWRSPSVKS